MYPKASLIKNDKGNLVVFERDFNNPFNEGFIIYWGISKSNKKKLIFKKRLNKIAAQKTLNRLKEQGWIKTNKLDKAA
tara:strand:+ start:59 stop:292 length:234 start_codon:yes stop_codon:yes gene_type:complete